MFASVYPGDYTSLQYGELPTTFPTFNQFLRTFPSAGVSTMRASVNYNVFLFVCFFFSSLHQVLAGSQLAHGAERYVQYKSQRVNADAEDEVQSARIPRLFDRRRVGRAFYYLSRLQGQPSPWKMHIIQIPNVQLEGKIEDAALSIQALAKHPFGSHNLEHQRFRGKNHDCRIRHYQEGRTFEARNQH